MSNPGHDPALEMLKEMFKPPFKHPFKLPFNQRQSIRDLDKEYPSVSLDQEISDEEQKMVNELFFKQHGITMKDKMKEAMTEMWDYFDWFYPPLNLRNRNTCNEIEYRDEISEEVVKEDVELTFVMICQMKEYEEQRKEEWNNLEKVIRDQVGSASCQFFHASCPLQIANFLRKISGTVVLCVNAHGGKGTGAISFSSEIAYDIMHRDIVGGSAELFVDFLKNSQEELLRLSRNQSYLKLDSGKSHPKWDGLLEELSSVFDMLPTLDSMKEAEEVNRLKKKISTIHDSLRRRLINWGNGNIKRQQTFEQSMINNSISVVEKSLSDKQEYDYKKFSREFEKVRDYLSEIVGTLVCYLDCFLPDTKKESVIRKMKTLLGKMNSVRREERIMNCSTCSVVNSGCSVPGFEHILLRPSFFMKGKDLCLGFGDGNCRIFPGVNELVEKNKKINNLFLIAGQCYGHYFIKSFERAGCGKRITTMDGTSGVTNSVNGVNIDLQSKIISLLKLRSLYESNNKTAKKKKEVEEEDEEEEEEEYGNGFNFGVGSSEFDQEFQFGSN